MAVDLTPNGAVQKAAQRGLRLFDAGKAGDGLQPQTVRDAHLMADRRPLSEAKVRKMPAWFARHEADRKAGWDKPGEETPGFVAWLLWGGDAGRRWSQQKVRQLDEEAQMGRDKPDAAIELRDIITQGERVLADSLVDGVEQYGRYDAESAEYVPDGGGGCAACVFYRGDEYAGVEGCVIVAADVQPEGACRLHIKGQLPVDAEQQEADETTTDTSDDAMEDETSLADALEDIDDALALGESDEDDEADDSDEPDSSGITVNVNVDFDAYSHNADSGSQTVVEDDAPWRSRETHTSRSAKAEWRESGAGSQYRTLSGYASVFNTPSDDLGGFREIIAPGAFTRALADPELNVCLLWNHDPDTVMASTRNGTLELAQDKRGLKMWARVDMTDFDAQRVVGKIRSGLVDQMSFAFTIADGGDDWDTRDGQPFRTVTDVGGLFDVSAVTWPAYPVGTKVELLERALRTGRVPGRARALVAQDDPAGAASSLITEGEALQRLKLKTRSRLAIAKLNITR